MRALVTNHDGGSISANDRLIPRAAFISYHHPG
jgi:hypothetical protein